MDKARKLPFPQQLRHLTGFSGRVGRNANVQRLSLLDGGRKRGGRFLQRSINIEAVRVKNIDIIQAHSLEALIQARQYVFA
jgi:hypothetical protein